ncbi:hypothetical protein JW916_03360 [Candidatus Sumerlaeota bacterium]|nr:hypothetical protein [Candidatus Sumerlaeota bacterium]
MTDAVGAFNTFLTAVFGLVCRPFQSLDPFWPVAFVSLVTGVLMVWIFGKVSNQKAIRVVRNRIRGNLIGVGLFRNDIGTVLRLQGRVLRDTLTYMRHSLVPMLVTIVPVVLIAIQLNLRFSVRPLHPGETAVVKATMREGVEFDSDVSIAPGDGIVVETAPVRVPATRETAWRIRVEKPGRYTIAIRSKGASVEKAVRVGTEPWNAVSAVRTGAGTTTAFLWPGEKPLAPSSPFESVEVLYPALHIEVLGWRIHWLVLFFVLSILFGFALKGVLGVEV